MVFSVEWGGESLQRYTSCSLHVPERVETTLVHNYSQVFLISCPLPPSLDVMKPELRRSLRISNFLSHVEAIAGPKRTGAKVARASSSNSLRTAAVEELFGISAAKQWHFRSWVGLEIYRRIIALNLRCFKLVWLVAKHQVFTATMVSSSVRVCDQSFWETIEGQQFVFWIHALARFVIRALSWFKAWRLPVKMTHP